MSEFTLNAAETESNAAASSVAAKFESAYGNEIEVVSKAMKDKYEHDWSVHDTIAFGQQADTWLTFKEIMESDTATKNVLGSSLTSNLGIVALQFSQLPVQALASLQPMTDSDSSKIFFRKGVAVNANGNVAAGDQLIGAYGSVNNDVDSFMSDTQTLSIPFVAGQTTYPLALGTELRPGRIAVSVAGGKIKGMDSGEGNILGVGVNADLSVVDMITGVGTLELVDPAGKGIVAGDMIDVTYQTDMVGSNTIPTMKWLVEDKDIRAEYFLLQSQHSTIAEMVLRKKMGMSLSADITADLISQATAATMNTLIRKLRNAAISNEVATGNAITWSTTPNAGTTQYDHRQTLDDVFIDAVDSMIAMSGIGAISALVIGSEGRKILRTAGMKSYKTGAVTGAHLVGNYDGIPCYYAPQSVLAKNEILCVYRSPNVNFQAAAVVAPFLPITTAQGSNGAGQGGMADNVLVNSTAVFSATGVEAVMPAFVQRVTIVA